MAKNENRCEADGLDEVRILRERIDKECPNSMGWRVVSLLESLKALEKQEFDYESRRSSDCSRLQEEVDELDKMLHSGVDDEGSFKSDRYFQGSNERLESAKKELATKLRSIVSVKRQLDEVPSQAELIQYELRFSELNTQIQKKLRQTRKHYDTYNALLEIKELMLKETSLLNSISLQFQNAITSADGRTKLINSLEGILNGTQQKLDKMQLTLQSEQKFCDTIKDKYAAAISEQRQSSSLLKLFQEECARNERLQAQAQAQVQKEFDRYEDSQINE
ncbi:Coiled-coil domain-containing protein 93 [Sesamum alatum]|uniref:Coiled-coil domain-containing protein 93 n=1 Tax=Sesamum alatum TaxID=300844 RepID=A0AAE1XYN8_9LAMI|nr:Coiled-coil domain-containing protein 93 [Sesamum alatum]